MSRRRHALAAVALAVLMTTAGCSFITGSESLSFTANQATVADQAQSDTGYERTRLESVNATRSFTVAGQSRNVSVTNWVAQYERAVDLGPLGERRAGVFAALSTPAVQVLGQTFNPVSQMSNRDLIQQFQQRYGSISVGELDATNQAEILGETRNVSRYEGTAELSGNEVDVYIHVAKFRHGDDYIVALAVYPQQLEGEQDRVMQLYRGLEHEAESGN